MDNKILKNYMVKEYAINEPKLNDLEKTIKSTYIVNGVDVFI